MCGNKSPLNEGLGSDSVGASFKRRMEFEMRSRREVVAKSVIIHLFLHDFVHLVFSARTAHKPNDEEVTCG